MFKIEKGVEIPPRVNKNDYKYPWWKMEIGDSVFIENGEPNSREASNSYTYGGRTGKKFSARKVPGGIRIWRVK